MKGDKTMVKCPKCGGINDDGVKFCAYCGQPMTAAGTVKEEFSEKVDQVINEFQNPADFSGEFTPDDIQKNKGISVLSYLGILLLIPWIARPNSKFARFHVNQGLVLFITELVIRFVNSVLKGVLGDSGLYGPIGIVFNIISILLFVLMIIGIVNAVKGEAKDLPIIGKLRFLKY